MTLINTALFKQMQQVINNEITLQSIIDENIYPMLRCKFHDFEEEMHFVKLENFNYDYSEYSVNHRITADKSVLTDDEKYIINVFIVNHIVPLVEMECFSDYHREEVQKSVKYITTKYIKATRLVAPRGRNVAV